MFKHTKLLVFVIILAGFFLRIYHLEKLAGFDYDQKIMAWWIKQLLVDKKISLIGQEISLGGIFIAPLYYYLLTPFYFIFKLDPLVANIFVSLISPVTMYLVYQVGTILFNKKSGLVALLIYAFSSQINFYDRTTAPSNLIMLLSLSSLYFLLTKRNFLLGPTLGMTFSVSPATILLIPQNLFFRFKNKLLLFSVISLMASPLFFFDLRHNFMITRRIFEALFSKQERVDFYSILLKFFANVQTLSQSFRQLFLNVQTENTVITFFLDIVTELLWLIIFIKSGFSFLQKKIFLIWLIVPLLFFSLYPYHVPEYYFLPFFPIAIIFFASFIFKKTPNKILLPVLSLFIIINTWLVFTAKNDYSMFYKKQTVKYILDQSSDQPFRIDYDVVVGQNNGFRYLFYWSGHESSSEAKLRYIITIPEDKNKLPGRVFGKIKVSLVNE